MIPNVVTPNIINATDISPVKRTASPIDANAKNIANKHTLIKFTMSVFELFINIIEED